MANQKTSKTYRLSKLVSVDSKDISISIRNRSCSVAEEHHDSVVSFSIVIKKTRYFSLNMVIENCATHSQNYQSQ